MQQRFAFALLLRLTRSSTPVGQSTQTRHGMVQATDAPTASALPSLGQLKKWIENVLLKHILSPTLGDLNKQN